MTGQQLFDADDYATTKGAYGVVRQLHPGENRVGKHHARPRPTELAAAKAIEPRTGTQRRGVLDAIRYSGERGKTDEELARDLHMSLNSVRPRRVELIEMGFVEASDMRRPTASGHEATVWVAVKRTDTA